MTKPTRFATSRMLRVLATTWVVASVVGGGLAACSPSPSPAPSGTVPSPSGPVASPPGETAAIADKVPLDPDGRVDEAGLFHDSRSDAYRVPYGAVTTGTRVTLRLRATAGDLTSATVRVSDDLAQVQALVPMAVVASDRTAGDHGYDWWQAVIHSPATPTVLHYRFIVADGPTTRYVEDDPSDNAGGGAKEGSDGGPGRVYTDSIDASWQISVAKAGFTTPDWTHGATVYQVFPDRYANGDPSNDPSPTATEGTTGAAVYRYGDVYGNPVLVKSWTDKPEGYCRAYTGVNCNEQPLGRDFFGGDLRGITQHLDDLAAMGVTALYLNPVFAAPSNHRYDTSDYSVIDPDLGTLADFDALAAAAKAKGIHLILDGVFNHVSSDSPWCDRARRYPTVGACESATSVYRPWFTFRAPAANEPSPCAASTKGGKDTYYAGWGGYDTIPEVTETTAFTDLIAGPGGIVGRWIAAGSAGWRLDVADNLSHGFLRKIRAATKAADPNAVVIAEQWQNSSAFLLGDQADTTMNYRFRRAVIGLVNGDTADLDGAIAGLVPSQFASRMEGIGEQYPAAAWDSLLNLVDSHDTTRILWTLAPGADNPAAKESAAALVEAKAKLRLVSAIQLTWPGMASIYYGTEAGLTGQDDPDDRRPYPWGSIDTNLQAWYRQLGQARLAHVALRTGDLTFLATDDKAGTMAYLRRADTEAAVVVLNLSTSPRAVSLDLGTRLPVGTVLTDALGGPGVTVAAAGSPVTLQVPARGVAILVTPAGTDLAAPAALTAAPTAAAQPGRVNLAWTSAPDGQVYGVYRSILPGGGYERIGTPTVPAFEDDTVRNGMHYFYVVTVLDAAGNESGRSPEADARPGMLLADAHLDAPATVSQPLSATDAGTTIAALVTPAAAAGVGIRAQLGIGAADATDPATAFTWSEMRYTGDAAGAARFTGAVRPEALGSFVVVLRVSTDGGGSWSYADRGGIVAAPGAQWRARPDKALTLTAVGGPDTTPPAAPANVRVQTSSETALTLAWDPVADAGLFRYEILRGTAPGGPYEVIGTATDPVFTDNGISRGSTYVYVVRAVDTGFNRSASSAEAAAQASARPVKVTFTLTVPASTPAKSAVFIAGDFQGWNPAGTPMTQMDATHWAITLPFTEGNTPQYKYVRGRWEAVEKDAACAEITNRTITVAYGADGTQAVADTVAKWRDVDKCP